jgi:hypothetical protein
VDRTLGHTMIARRYFDLLFQMISSNVGGPQRTAADP